MPYRSASSYVSGNSSTIVLDKPAGLAENDFMLAEIVHDSSAPSSVPSGWAILPDSPVLSVNVGGDTTRRTHFYYKVATASEPASYTWTMPSATNVAAGLVAYSGIDPSNPINRALSRGYLGAVAPASWTTEVIIPNAEGCEILACFGADSANAAGATDLSVSGFTQRVDVYDPSSFYSCGIFDLTQVSPAAIDATATYITGGGALYAMTMIVALNPVGYEIVVVPPHILWGTIAASVDAAAPFTVTGSLPFHKAGDILVACASKNDAADLTCGTSGWAEIVPAQNNANFSTAWFWKRASSSSETPPVITSSTAGSTTAGIYAGCARIRGCIATGNPFEDATLGGSPTLSTTPPSSVITTTGEQRLAAAIAAFDDDMGVSSTPPATWTLGANIGSSTGGDARFTAIHKAIAAAGDVASVNIGVAASSDYWRTLTLAFVPEPAPVVASRLKRWNGSAWVVANFKHYNGSIWVPATWKKLP